jgi:chain length determinant protein (polysaccharide antigen chain regulator)
MEENRGQFPPQSAPGSFHPAPASEFGLLDLWQVLIGKWKLLLAGIIFSVLVAILYLGIVTPVYEAEVILLPPEAQHVSALNLKDLSKITAAEIYGDFIRNLKSNSLRRQFFDQSNLGAALNRSRRPFADDAEVFKHQFNDLLKVRVGTNNEAGFVSVSLRGENPEQIKDLLNRFVLLAARQTISEIIDGISKQIHIEMEMLNDQIQMNRVFAKELRLDRIAMLEEQLAIARGLNINSMDISLQTVEGPSIGFAVTISDDPFIAGLLEKQIRLSELGSGLKNLQAGTNNIYAARVDQKASSPVTPLKPRRILVLAQGLVLGVVLGTFTAFLANFIEQRSTCPGDKGSKAVAFPVS